MLQASVSVISYLQSILVLWLDVRQLTAWGIPGSGLHIVARTGAQAADGCWQHVCIYQLKPKPVNEMNLSLGESVARKDTGQISQQLKLGCELSQSMLEGRRSSRKRAAPLISMHRLQISKLPPYLGYRHSGSQPF